MFKNLSIFLFDQDKLPLNDLEAVVKRRLFAPVSGQDMSSMGWVSPRQDGDLIYRQGQNCLLRLQVEKRLVPGEVVKRKLAEAVADFELKSGYKPGAKKKRELKEEILHTLIPKAFTKIETHWVWIDGVNGWFAIEGKVDLVIEAFRSCVEEFPLAPLNTEVSPQSAMFHWLNGEAPDGFTIDDECELKATDSKATVKYAKLNLDRKDLREHLSEGKMPIKLAMTYGELASFVLTDKFEFKRLAYLNVPEARETADEDIFASDFAVMTGTLPGLFSSLKDAVNQA